MAISAYFIIRLCLNAPKRQILEARDNILINADFRITAQEVFSFAVILILNRRPDVANQLLEKLFQVPGFEVEDEEQVVLELFWNEFSGRPANTPWGKWNKPSLHEVKRSADPQMVEFFENWARVLEMVSKSDWNVLDIYGVLVTSTGGYPLHVLSEAEIEEIYSVLRASLMTRIMHGCKPPLHDISTAELLRRFSKAAFFVKRDEYLRNGINSPGEVLCPPLTPEEIIKAEERLGPLPADVKEIALIADGFYGGWHFASGGWPGISCLGPAPASFYEARLYYEPGGGKPIKEWPHVYAAGGRARCDDFEHVLCPAHVWKLFQEEKGKVHKEGEYGYLSFAHWTDGNEVVHSVRGWIAGMTVSLERDVAVGHRD